MPASPDSTAGTAIAARRGFANPWVPCSCQGAAALSRLRPQRGRVESRSRRQVARRRGAGPERRSPRAAALCAGRVAARQRAHSRQQTHPRRLARCCRQWFRRERRHRPCPSGRSAPGSPAQPGGKGPEMRGRRRLCFTAPLPKAGASLPAGLVGSYCQGRWSGGDPGARAGCHCGRRGTLSD